MSISFSTALYRLTTKLIVARKADSDLISVADCMPLSSLLKTITRT